LLIATKYEEIYPPTVKDFIYISKNAYTKPQILAMEMDILSTLEFKMSETSSYRFLQRYAKVAKASPLIFNLAQYLLELGLLDSKMNQYLPSLQASGALYVANRVLLKSHQNRQDRQAPSCWTKLLETHTHYSSDDLKSCAKNFLQLAELIQKSELQTLLLKFAQKQHLEVATIMNRAL
jgi:cyclin B